MIVCAFKNKMIIVHNLTVGYGVPWAVLQGVLQGVLQCVLQGVLQCVLQSVLQCVLQGDLQCVMQCVMQCVLQYVVLCCSLLHQFDVQTAVLAAGCVAVCVASVCC